MFTWMLLDARLEAAKKRGFKAPHGSRQEVPDILVEVSDDLLILTRTELNALRRKLTREFLVARRRFLKSRKSSVKAWLWPHGPEPVATRIRVLSRSKRS